MLDALIMTLGFEPGPLISSVALHAAEGFRSGAKIIVLTPNFPDERVERAWRQLQNIFDMMKLKDVGVELMRLTIDLDDFSEAVLQVKSIFSEIKNKKIQISLVGGMRALILATFIAYLLTDWRIPPNIEVSLEGRGILLKIPDITPITASFNKRKMQLLRVMSPNKVYKPRELCTILKKDRSTVYRHLKALHEAGFVERVDRGFRLTMLGKIVR